MTAVMFLASQMPTFAGEWRGMLRQQLEMAATHPDQLVPVWRNAWPVFRGVALAAGMSLGGGDGRRTGARRNSVRPKTLAPNWKRLDPVSHVEQLFSLAAVSRLLKSLLPTAVIVYFAVGVLVRDYRFPSRTAARQPPALLAFAVGRMYEVAWKGCLVLLLWAGADYFLERQRHESEMKMSKQDQKDEFKEMEGNPVIKQRIRRLQRQARRRRMLKDVERAAVVITNPTEFAVALEYRMEMDAPVVVAKGATCWPRRSRKLRAGKASPSWKIPHWLMPSTGQSKWARPFQRSSTPWSRKSWRPSGGRRRAPRKFKTPAQRRRRREPKPWPRTRPSPPLRPPHCGRRTTPRNG